MAVEMSTKDTAQIVTTEGDKKEMDTISKVITLLTATAVGVSVLSLVLAFVGAANNGSYQYYIQTSSGNGLSGNASSQVITSEGTSRDIDITRTIDGEKIWMLQIGNFQSNTQYLDEDSGTIQGYNVDVVNAVCQLANKNCELVSDLYENCWNSQVGQRPRGGTGLMSRWYDACVGWIITSDRSRTFKFTDEFEKRVDVALWVNKNDSIPGATDNRPDLSNLNVGFVDGWFADEHCLGRYEEVMGFDELDEDQVKHYQNEASLIDAINSGEIDTAFASVRPSRTSNDSTIEAIWTPVDNKCLLGGIALMTQKDQLDLLTWWNYAFDRLRVTTEYKEICERLGDEYFHGDQPGFAPEDVCV